MTEKGGVVESAVPSGQDLQALRRIVQRQGQSRRVAAWACAAVAIGYIALLTLIAPATSAQAFGLAHQATAVVETVTRPPGQSDKDKRNPPIWLIHVAWQNSSGLRQGFGTVRQLSVPYRAGDQVAIFFIGSQYQVSFHTAGEAWANLGVILAIPAVCAIAACLYWRGARQWSHLPGVVTRIGPESITLCGEVERYRRRASRYAVLERGYLANARIVTTQEPINTFLLLESNRHLVPTMNDNLQLWSENLTRQPAAIRRLSDGAWWLTTYL